MSEIETVRVWDAILPNLPFTNKYYQGSTEDYTALLYNMLARISGIVPSGEEFDFQASKFSLEQMSSNTILLRFLQMLIRLSGSQRVLEIGTWVGVSTVYMGSAVGDHGHVTTVEHSAQFAEVARRNFRANNLDDRITLLQGDALEIVKRMPDDESYDLIFLDGDKGRYSQYFAELHPKLRSGGLFLVDDILFQGDVLNPEPVTEKARGLVPFLDEMEQLKGYFRLALPLGNGVLLLLKE